MSKAKQHQLSLLNRIIGYFSPSLLMNRLISQRRNEILLRGYDAAKTFSISKKNNKSANQEVKTALEPIRNSARELVRNMPFAKKGVEIISNGIVGWGIEVSIEHKDEKVKEKIKAELKHWLKKGCAIDPRSDFYTLQKQGCEAVVTDGEVLLREIVLDRSVRFQLLEADYIATNYSEKTTNGTKWVNGVLVDKYYRPIKYALFTSHPNETGLKKEIEFVSADEVELVFDPIRAQQNRGISWLAAVLNTIETLSEIQWTHLSKLKLSASLTAIVTKEPSQLSPELQKQQREEEWTNVEPNTVHYMNHGEKIEFPDVPNAEGFDGATKLTLREIASGLGVTYEALSGDLSGVNFSSGRMGDLQFRANVERWRWHVFIPRMLERMIEGFKKQCRIKGIDVSEATFTFVPPARQMINPTEEIAATKSAIRNGLLSYDDAIRENGQDPDEVRKKIAASNKKLDDLNIVLDCDPRRIGNEQLQATDILDAINKDQKNN